MPELPEVETVKNELEPHVVGRRISDITLNWERMVKQPSAEEFRSRLIGQRIAGVARRGKYLVFSLGSGEVLIIHLKMTGSLLLNAGPEEKYIRAIIFLDDGNGLYFRDPRKFGAMWLAGDKESIVGRLGLEPLEAGFTPDALAQILHDRAAPIKALLCDQFLIAGIGNMYADEALFAAGIHPLRTGGSLSRGEIERLHESILQVLRSGIDNKGASIMNYFRPGGEPGTAHMEFKVAHRGGKPCPACGMPIQRIPVRNRGSYFCPKCQPEN